MLIGTCPECGQSLQNIMLVPNVVGMVSGIKEVKMNIATKEIRGKPHYAVPVICHHCWRGPTYIPCGDPNTARRICNRCELVFWMCDRCRQLGWILSDYIVNDKVLNFALGQRRNWFCDLCTEEL